MYKNMSELTVKHVFNAGNSAAVGAAALQAVLQDHVANKGKQ